MPSLLISYYLRQIFCPSWQAGSSLFKPLGWGSKITPAGTAIQGWMIPTQWLGDISDYGKLLFFKKGEGGSALTNSKWRKFIHNLHIRIIIEKRKTWSLGEEKGFIHSIGFYPEYDLCGQHHLNLVLLD